MKHDITKLHPIHQQMYMEFAEGEFTKNAPEHHLDGLYNLYLVLSELPEEDWATVTVVS